MKLKQAVAAVAGAFCVTAASAVTIQLPTGPINALSFDWDFTSFLAKDGISAVNNFVATGGACQTASCSFDVRTHAKLTTYGNGSQSGLAPVGINQSFELTMVGGFAETVNAVLPLSQGSAFFTGIANTGFIQLYLDTNVNANNLQGTGFNDGRLILVGVLGNNPLGSFTVTTRDPTVDLDQNGVDDWGNQQTVVGGGSNINTLEFTVLGFDPTVFTGGIDLISLLFPNVSIALPFTSVDPSKCFSEAGGRGVGGIGSNFVSTTCGDGEGLAGILPQLGLVNGGNGEEDGPDFMAQTDFNSSLNATSVPEPGSIALLAGALLAGGAFSRRRRQKA